MTKYNSDRKIINFLVICGIIHFLVPWVQKRIVVFKPWIYVSMYICMSVLRWAKHVAHRGPLNLINLKINPYFWKKKPTVSFIFSKKTTPTMFFLDKNKLNILVCVILYKVHYQETCPSYILYKNMYKIQYLRPFSLVTKILRQFYKFAPKVYFDLLYLYKKLIRHYQKSTSFVKKKLLK